ncbi:MAG: citramalate synthase [Chthoniobacterales bacterium]
MQSTSTTSSAKQTVKLYDTTLRDGTQGEGVSFSILDKIRVAEKLDTFGMHYIEGGWPGSNPKDIAFFEEAKRRTWQHAKIAAFGSTRRANTTVEKDPQIQTLVAAETPVVTLVGKTWKLHVTDILNTTPEENRAMITDSVRYFKKLGKEVMFDAEHFFDGYKDDPEHTLAALDAAKDCDVLVLCDTNGGTMPDEIERIVAHVESVFPGQIGIHTHNDCELGVANALAAIRAGAVQVQGTTNGYGERTGNCNLTSVIPNLQLKMGFPVVEDLTKLRELSNFVDELANLSHNIRAPFVGATAFAHKGGLHVNAVQKLARSYEHIQPEAVGNFQNILVSELSGQSNILVKAKELGFDFKKGSPEVLKLLEAVKKAESKGYEYEAADASLALLILDELGNNEPLFELQEYHCSFRRGPSAPNCEATVKLSVKGEEAYTVAEGDGPVNALDAATRKALKPFYSWISDVALRDYKVRIIDGSRGTAATTRVHIVFSDGKHDWATVGVSDNVIEASWLALVDSFSYAAWYRRSVS